MRVCLLEASMRQHGVLTRMFLREYAFHNRFAPSCPTSTVWSRAALSLSIVVAVFALLAIDILSIPFLGFVDERWHPLTARGGARIIEVAVVFACVGALIDLKFARYKHNSNVAWSFSSRSEVAKWWLTTGAAIGGVVGLILLPGWIVGRS